MVRKLGSYCGASFASGDKANGASNGLISCFPTLAAKTNTPQGWGTHFIAGSRMGNRGRYNITRSEIRAGKANFW